MKIQDPTLRKLAAKLARPKRAPAETRVLPDGTVFKGARGGKNWHCAGDCEVERVGKANLWRITSGNVFTEPGSRYDFISGRGIRLRIKD